MKRQLAGAELPLVIEGNEVYAGRPWPPWRAHGLSRHRRRVLITTWRSWAPGPPDWARPSMRRRTDSRPSCSKPMCRAARPRTPRLIENFFGFLDGIGGAELARRAGRQAEKFGAEIVMLRGVSAAAHARDRPLLRVVGGTITAASCSRRRGWIGGSSRSKVSTTCSTEVSITAPDEARQPSAPARRRRGRRWELGRPGGHEPRRFGSARPMACAAASRQPHVGLPRRARPAHPLIDVRLETQVTALDEADGQLGSVTLTARRARRGGCRPALSSSASAGCLIRSGPAGSAYVIDEAGYVLTGPDLLDEVGDLRLVAGPRSAGAGDERSRALRRRRRTPAARSTGRHAVGEGGSASRSSTAAWRNFRRSVDVGSPAPPRLRHPSVLTIQASRLAPLASAARSHAERRAGFQLPKCGVAGTCG